MIPTNRIELPIHAYEAFLNLQDRMLRYEIDPTEAVSEAIEILSPYWDHQPQPWEATEIVLRRSVMSSGL